MTLLALKHRPSQFVELVGQDPVRAVLQALVFAGDMPAALLFSGSSGTGKTSAARILAAALNCERPSNGDCCAACRSCTEVRAGASMSVHEVDAATHGGVDEIRALKELAQFSTDGAWRVILLDEAHALSRQAENALLKVLEEPPPRTVFVLLTTEPDKIAETVRSRAMPIDFRPVPFAILVSRLRAVCQASHISMPDEVLAEIAETADGGVRDAVMLLDQAQRVQVSSLAELRALTGRTDHPARIVAALVASDHTEARTLLADFFTTSADAGDLIAGMVEDLQARFANHTLSHKRMVAATKLLWDARSIPASPARTARAQIESLVTLLYAVFREDKPPANPPILRVKSPKSAEENGSDRLSLDELVGLLTPSER
jgi:DNA polymerase-3 subunit gamma/tau